MKFGRSLKARTWCAAAVLAAVAAAGCGSGDEGQIFGEAGNSGNPGPAGAGPNLGLAAPFGIAATTGVTNTPTAPLSHINGNVILDPGATCNAVALDGAGGFGLCGGSPPTINGTVVSSLFDPSGNRAAIRADMNAAFLSITPPAGPPAAGSRGGATNLPAGTTLGEPTGSALVQGDNLFVPGIYQSLTSILITGDITLDAQGNSSAVFIFQSSSSIGAAVGARILLVNGAQGFQRLTGRPAARRPWVPTPLERTTSWPPRASP